MQTVVVAAEVVEVVAVVADANLNSTGLGRSSVPTPTAV
jgi:hypothetical protein